MVTLFDNSVIDMQLFRVTIPAGARIKGSIVEEICIPAIKKNPNAIIVEPDVSSDTAVIKKAFIKTIKSGFIVKKTSYEVRFQDEAAARDNGNQKFESLEACYDFIDKVRAAGYNVAPDVEVN